MSIKVINWESQPGLQEWKMIAAEKQMLYHQLFKSRRWERYKKSESIYVKAKIGYAFFGPPVDAQETSIEKFYNSSQKYKIEEIFTAVKKVTGNADIITIGFLFLIAIIRGEYMEFPVLRVLKTKQKDGEEHHEIIDPYGYTYKSWEKFITTNSLPYGIYCYPKSGFYSSDEMGQIEIGFRYFTGGSSIISEIASFVSGSKLSRTYSSLVPCSPNIKGISTEIIHYSVPVSSVNGSVEVYAIHATQALAKSSQCTENIPRIIAEALDFGFIKLNWFSVINNAQYEIQNESIITNRHISRVIASALFFCNSVLSPELTKSIVKEMKQGWSRPTILIQKQKFFLKKSLMIDGKLKHLPLTKSLKFINERSVALSEMIDKHFRTHFTIPDQFGNYHTIGELLDRLENPCEINKCMDILTNYCIVLEETIKNCNDCRKIIEDDKTLIDKLHQTADNMMTEENVLYNNLESDQTLNTSQQDSFTFSPSTPSNLTHDTESTSSKKGKFTKSDWLLGEVYNSNELLKTPTILFVNEDHFSYTPEHTKRPNSSTPLGEENPARPHKFEITMRVLDKELNNSKVELLNSLNSDNNRASLTYDFDNESCNEYRTGIDQNNNDEKIEMEPGTNNGSEPTIGHQKIKNWENKQFPQDCKVLAGEIISLESSPLHKGNEVQDILHKRNKKESPAEKFTERDSDRLQTTKIKEDHRNQHNHPILVSQTKISANHMKQTDYGKKLKSPKNCNKCEKNFVQTSPLHRVMKRSPRKFTRKDAINIFQKNLFEREKIKEARSKFMFFGLLLIIIMPSFLQVLGPTVRLVYF